VRARVGERAKKASLGSGGAHTRGFLLSHTQRWVYSVVNWQICLTRFAGVASAEMKS
jgi:hypothetical protein